MNCLQVDTCLFVRNVFLLHCCLLWVCTPLRLACGCEKLVFSTTPWRKNNEKSWGKYLYGTLLDSTGVKASPKFARMLAERKLIETDKTLTTSQLFCRNVRRENKMWKYLQSQQTWNKTFLKDLCLGLLSDTSWWSLLRCPRTFLISGPTQPLPRQQTRTCACIWAVSLVWHTNANYFNKPTKASEMGWGCVRTKLCFPLCCCYTSTVKAFKGPTLSPQVIGNGNILLQQSSPNKTQVTHRIPYCKTWAGLKRLDKSAFPHL